jgi:hypothetical protein
MAQARETYRKHVITWQDPPPAGAGWEMTVAAADNVRKAQPARAVSTKGPWQLEGCATRSEGVAKARVFIDSLLA